MKKRQKNITRNVKKQNEGITLIALVITIIVLLILAGVAIATLTGDNGLLSKASGARDTSTEAEVMEKIKLAYEDYYLGQYTNPGYTFQDALDKMFGENVATATGPDSNGVYTVSINGKTYEFDPATKQIQPVSVIDWDTILANAQKHPDQSSTNDDIGVDMYGNPVNLDNWFYEFDEENGTFATGKGAGSKLQVGYIKEITDKTVGKIEGELPEYIIKNNKRYYLTDMTSAFSGNTDLKIVPNIPSTVTNMSNAFYGCTSLTTVGNIPNLVTDMSETFYGCTSLTTIGNIPDLVTNMDQTFRGCTSLTTVGNIGNSVTTMTSTFANCTSLTTVGNIGNSVTDMSSTFASCTSLTTAPTIPNSVVNMSYTFAECTSLTTAPTIPNSVTSLPAIFSDCPSLTGNLIINAICGDSMWDTYEALANAATNDGCNLIVSGTSPKLDAIISTASSNSHVTKGN